MDIVLTGIKPTGTPHIGNYVGAIKPAVVAEHEQPSPLLFLPGRLPRDRWRGRRRRAHDARDRRKLAGTRARSGQGRVLPPVRRAGDSRARVDSAQRDGQRAHEPRARLQSRGRRERGHAGARSGPGHHDEPVLLSRADGRRHPDVQGHEGAGRQGSEAARRDGARHRPALQPQLRRDVRAARARDRRAHRHVARLGRPQDEQELRQCDSAVRRREGAAQDRHEDQDELARAGAAEGYRRQRVCSRSIARSRPTRKPPLSASATRPASAGER